MGNLWGWEGMALPARAHPAALMEGAGQSGRGQTGTAWRPGHQASPWVMSQVQGQAERLVHGSGSVQCISRVHNQAWAWL